MYEYRDKQLPSRSTHNVLCIVNVSVNRYVNTDVLKERIKIPGVIAQKVVEVLLVFQTELGS